MSGSITVGFCILGVAAATLIARRIRWRNPWDRLERFERYQQEMRAEHARKSS